MLARPHSHRAHRDSITVERIDDAGRLAAIAGEWDQLLDDDSLGAVFRSAAWLLPWWNHFSSGRELRVYTARLGGRLFGLLPAYRVATALGGRRLRLMGDGIVGSDYLGVAARPGEEEEAARAIA